MRSEDGCCDTRPTVVAMSSSVGRLANRPCSGYSSRGSNAASGTMARSASQPQLSRTGRPRRCLGHRKRTSGLIGGCRDMLESRLLVLDLLRRAQFTTVGAGFFAALAAFGLPKPGRLWGFASLAISIGLLALIFQTRERFTKTLGKGSSPVARRRSYLVIQMVEYAGFVITVVVCSLLGRPELIGVVSIAISGLHFLALAAAIGATASWVKGGLLCGICVAAIISSPLALSRELGPGMAWLTVPCFAAALVLWSDAVIAVLGAQRAARQTVPADSIHVN
jgi:hypothetical protein